MWSTEPIIARMLPAGAYLALAQDLRLLGLELFLCEDPVVAELRQPLQLGRGRRRRRLRRRRCVRAIALVHPLLVLFALLVDHLLDLFGVPNVVEAVPAELRRGRDHQRAGA